MEIDETEAYALATWKRLEDHISDDVLRAVCGAFAVIAVADGDLDRREIDAFLHMVDTEFKLPEADFIALQGEFLDLADAVMSDPEAGRKRALSEVAVVRENERAVELVIAAARLAVRANERIVPAEVEALDAVCEVLGIQR